MGYLERLAKRNNQKPEDLRRLIFGLICLMLLAVFMIVDLSLDIRSYSKVPVSDAGCLEDVGSGGTSVIQLKVNGEIYRLKKADAYSNRSFGVLDNMKKGPLMQMLHEKKGQDVQIEYIETGGFVTKGNNRLIVQLSIDGIEIVDKDAAIEDLIGYDRSTKYVGIGILIVALTLFYLCWKGILR